MISLFKMAPKNSVEVLSRVPKHRKVWVCLMEKIYALDKLPSGICYSAIGHELNVNESTIYIK